jgi:hypothetical protein
MSLQIDITSPVAVEIRPADTIIIENSIVINRIIDLPSQRKVRVAIEGTIIDLDSLSGDNYDTPDEWTNADIIDAVKEYFGIE